MIRQAVFIVTMLFVGAASLHVVTDAMRTADAAPGVVQIAQAGSSTSTTPHPYRDTIVAQADVAIDAGVEPTPAPSAETGSAGSAGSGSAATPAPTPADSIDNPLTSPLAAWDDIKVAKQAGWAMLIWTLIAMFGKVLAYTKDKLGSVPIVGRLAAWLSKGKRVMIVAGLGAVGSAGVNALAAGGTWVAALFASAIAIAGYVHSTIQRGEAK